MLGTIVFSYAHGETSPMLNTNLVLTLVIFIAATQWALSMLGSSQHFWAASFSTVIWALMYGFNVRLVSSFVGEPTLLQAQPLHVVHALGLLALTISWLSVLFLKPKRESQTFSSWQLKSYVAALNASQPHPSTVTSHRNDYQYQ